MKKLSLAELRHRDAVRYRIWQKQVRRKAKLSRRKANSGGPRDIPSEISVIPPTIFSFSKNYEATVGCLRELKNAALLNSNRRQRRRPVFIDIAEIEEISVAGALVLAAEIDRWRKHAGKAMRPRNLLAWTPAVRSLLGDLGFFKLLGVRDDSWLDSRDDTLKTVTVLPMVSNVSLDQAVMLSLSKISAALHADPSVYGALVEATYNVTKHAYPDNFNWEYPPTVKGWWATASLDTSNNNVKFVVFDQGVGIAETLPRWQGWEKVRGIISQIPFNVGDSLSDESNMIKAALEVDRTSLAGGHGQGLQDVIQLVQGFEGAEVRILSGRGSVLYKSKDQLVLKDQPLHIGGTLIEWTIPVQGSQG